jgi:hypothetical protein
MSDNKKVKKAFYIILVGNRICYCSTEDNKRTIFSIRKENRDTEMKHEKKSGEMAPFKVVHCN